MSIVLFAIIGAYLKLGTGYWICFGLFCLFKLFGAIKSMEDYREKM